MSVVAVVLAGGSGHRMGSAMNKVLLPVGDRPVLAWSIDMLASHPAVSAVVLVIRAVDRPIVDALVAASVGGAAVAAVVDGGTTRHASEQAGLRAATDLRPRTDLVAVHDAARPFADHALLDRLIAATTDHDGSLPGIRFDAPVHRRAARTLTPVPTGDLIRVQTPQVFRTDRLVAAFVASAADGFEGVDTAQILERFDPAARVAWVPGDPANVKLTTPADLARAERWLSARGHHLDDGGLHA